MLDVGAERGRDDRVWWTVQLALEPIDASREGIRALDCPGEHHPRRPALRCARPGQVVEHDGEHRALVGVALPPAAAAEGSSGSERDEVDLGVAGFAAVEFLALLREQREPRGHLDLRLAGDVEALQVLSGEVLIAAHVDDVDAWYSPAFEFLDAACDDSPGDDALPEAGLVCDEEAP